MTDTNDAVYEAARAAYHGASSLYAAALERRAYEEVLALYPTAQTITVRGEFGEEMEPRLRLQQVLDVDGVVLWDVDDPDEATEEAMDTINSEYLDQLVDITGDDWHGENELCSPAVTAAGHGTLYVAEGWWHRYCNAGRVHDHPESPNRAWQAAMHRLCQPIYTARKVPA